VRYLVHRYMRGKALSLILLDVVVVAGATASAIWLRLGSPFSDSFSPEGRLYPVLSIIFVHMVVLYYHDLYNLRGSHSPKRLYVEVAQSVALASALLFGFYYLVPELSVGRGIFLINMIILPQFLWGTRMAYLWAVRQEALLQRVALLGEAEEVRDVGERLEHSPDYLMVGCILSGEPDGTEGCPPILGPLEELRDIAVKYEIDTLIVAMRERRGRLPLQDLLYLKLHGINVDNQSSFVERVTGRVPVAGLPPSTLVFSDGFRRITMYQRIKFVPDLLTAAVLLVLAAPLMLLTAVAIRLDSAGPVLFRQRRVGRAGEVFEILKFRTMRVDAEVDGAQFAQTGDPRVTRVGRFLRRSRLDELPQLLNVLKGEMAFVGPRPERPEFVADLQEKIPYYYLRTVIRPGITGWAQIRYPYGATLKEHREKLEHDLYYIKNISLTLDALITFDTLRVVLFARGGR
jgi:sugar transferase (PEP-CTERM system associated)